jgi:hypothetical protein
MSDKDIETERRRETETETERNRETGQRETERTGSQVEEGRKAWLHCSIPHLSS